MRKKPHSSNQVLSRPTSIKVLWRFGRIPISSLPSELNVLATDNAGASQPSDGATVAERGLEIADLLLRGLQEGVLAEQEQERRLDRATREIKAKPPKPPRKKSPPVV